MKRALKVRGRDDKGWKAQVAAHYCGNATATAPNPPEEFYPLYEEATGRTADEAYDALTAKLNAGYAGR